MGRRSARVASASIFTNIASIAADDLADSDNEFPLDLCNVDQNSLVGSDEEDDDEDDNGEDNDDDDDEENVKNDADVELEANHDSENDSGEDSSDEGAVVLGKRTQGPAKNKVKPVKREITYTISVYSPAQMKKAKSSRGAPITDIVTLDNDEPWDTLKAQILAKISAALNLNPLIYDNYDVVFTVRTHVPEPIRLDTAAKYKHLVSNALRIKSSAAGKIAVEPKLTRATAIAVDDNDDEDEPKWKRRKTTVPKEHDIPPGNEAKNTQIGAIRAKWLCPNPGGPCGSTYCFVHPDKPKYFPLNHQSIDSWASAILKGNNFATLDKLPNNELFDEVGAAALSARSPLLQRRLDAKEKNSASSAPQINFNFPPEFAALLRPPAPAAPAAPAPPPDPHAALPHPTVPMLIPHPLILGPNLSIAQFCEQYNLDDDIKERFLQNKFCFTDSFKYVELSELKTMEFMGGEIVELKAAIEKWAQGVV
ncbi:hypothetical protein C8J57DRAFT_1497665 [Mycena rebaudengoi]|nr:hypothetical protein C8J57DRAFT_1497665 [Mycena rebaudengoi]